MITVAFVGFQGSEPLLTTYNKSHLLWIAGAGEIDVIEQRLRSDCPQLLVVTAPAVKKLWKRGVPLPPLRIIIRQR